MPCRLPNACLTAGRRNIKLEIEYDGTNYAGWQIQNSRQSPVASRQSRTIQETIEGALQRILQEKVKLIGSGRTDAGVHALGQVANFKTNSSLPLANIQKALNSLLPEDISIKKINPVEEDFHSRYQAKSKIYRYIILNSDFPSVFLNKYAWHIPYKLNLKLMQSEARYLLGRHDFKSFCASASNVKTTVRTIKKISINTIRYTLYAIRSPLIAIDIEADGFLYNMVRNITGTLVDIGRGRFSRSSGIPPRAGKKGSIKKILLAKDRRLAGSTAPAKGLFLSQVNY